MRYPKRTSLYVYMIVNIIEPMCANGTWGGAKGMLLNQREAAQDKSAELGGGSAVFSFFFLGFFGDISRLCEGNFGENGSAELIYED